MRWLLLILLCSIEHLSASGLIAPQVTTLRKEGSTWSMEWHNPSNHDVVVEKRDSLQSGTWQQIGSADTNSLGFFYDFSPTARTAFYRLAVKPLAVSMQPFNPAFVRTQTYQFLRIRNQTTNDATIYFIEDINRWGDDYWWSPSPSESFAFQSEPTYDPQIRAGATVYIPLRFHPNIERTHSSTGVIHIQWSDRYSSVEFPISGTAVSNSMDDMVFVQGGTLANSSPLSGQQVANFYIGRFEITKGEWGIIREWANANGYDIPEANSQSMGSNTLKSAFTSAPYSSDIIMKWCNAASERAGFSPVYTVNGQVYRTGLHSTATGSLIRRNISADGYRLPTTAEWEWAARGGASSQGYTYSGGNTLTNVAWLGSSVGVVGSKSPNELGLYDMSGNLWEWCSVATDAHNAVRGGSWTSSGPYAYECELSYPPRGSRASYSPDFYLTDFAGFRPVRNAP